MPLARGIERSSWGVMVGAGARRAEGAGSGRQEAAGLSYGLAYVGSNPGPFTHLALDAVSGRGR